MTTQPTAIPESFLDDTGPRKGILAWITSTDHKRVGILYLYSALTFFGMGVVLGFMMRLVQLRYSTTGSRPSGTTPSSPSTACS